jgi:hypothetical protein
VDNFQEEKSRINALSEYSSGLFRVTLGRSLKIFPSYSRSSNQLGQGYDSIKCHHKWSSQSTLDNRNPRFGLVENTDSDNGSYFTANIVKEFTKALDLKWKYHNP